MATVWAEEQEEDELDDDYSDAGTFEWNIRSSSYSSLHYSISNYPLLQPICLHLGFHQICSSFQAISHSRVYYSTLAVRLSCVIPVRTP